MYPEVNCDALLATDKSVFSIFSVLAGANLAFALGARMGNALIG